MNQHRLSWHVLLATSVIAVAAQTLWGGGFEIPNQGARGAGQAEAFIAQSDDASAIYYNPSGLTQLHGTSFTGGLYGLFPDWNFQGSNGGSQTMNLPSVLPHFYMESDLGTEKLRVGFGIDNSFGLNEDWGNTGPLRTIVDDAHLYVINMSPTIAYQVTDSLSLGLAMNVYYGNIGMTRNVVLAAPPVPEGTLDLQGSAWAFGVSPGLMWKIDEHNTIGAVYHTPFTLNFGGNTNIKTAGIPEIGPSSTHESIRFPQIAGIAYAVRPIKQLKLEADVVWTDWSTFHSVTLNSQNPAFNGLNIPENWQSGFSYRFGVQYDLDEHWTVRAGYAYGEDAIPATTFSPLLPDSAYHLFTVGVGYTTPTWGVDVAYQFAYRETRHIGNNTANSPIVDGTWDNQINCVMVSLTYRL